MAPLRCNIRPISKLLACASLVAVANMGCSKQPADRVQRPGKPDFVYARVNDQEMAAAMRRAQETLPLFAAALADERPGTRAFAIKKAYSDGKHTEYIWLSRVVRSGEGFEATVDNTPVWLSDVKVGSRAMVERNDVVDWMFVENGTLVGGFTIRVLFFREPPEKQRELERTFGFKVPPP
jgi:uncharacterized protein YegJ (DUF2314 family)